MLDLSYYGTLAEAEQYFGMRLHEHAWREADPRDNPKALYGATRIIDNLNFKGHRHTVWVLESPCDRTTMDGRVYQRVAVADARPRCERPKWSSPWSSHEAATR